MEIIITVSLIITLSQNLFTPNTQTGSLITACWDDWWSIPNEYRQTAAQVWKLHHAAQKYKLVTSQEWSFHITLMTETLPQSTWAGYHHEGTDTELITSTSNDFTGKQSYSKFEQRTYVEGKKALSGHWALHVEQAQRHCQGKYGGKIIIAVMCLLEAHYF